MHGAGLVPVQLLGKENSKSWVRIIFFSLNLVFKCGSFRIFCWDSYREAPVYTLGSGNTDNWEEARFLSLDEYSPGWCCLDSHVCHRWFLVEELHRVLSCRWRSARRARTPRTRRSNTSGTCTCT